MLRYDIINDLIHKNNFKTYLEIGVRNPDECFNLISNHYEYKGYDEYFGKLRENITKAQRFSLMDEQQSRIVEVFVT